MSKAKAKWEERVRAWRESGETAAEFAKGKPFKPSTLAWWASQLAKPTRPTLAMARVVRVAMPPSTAMTVTLGRARVEVSRGFDAQLLRDLVACLGGPS